MLITADFHWNTLLCSNFFLAGGGGGGGVGVGVRSSFIEGEKV